MKVQPIALDQIEDTTTPAPRDLMDSILSRGQLVPVVLFQGRAGRKFRIIDGMRRIAAIRALWDEYHKEYDRYKISEDPDKVEPTPPPETVAAHIRHKVSPSDRALDTLTFNGVRSRNYAAEADAVGLLLEDGFSERAITQATGVSLPKVKELSKLKAGLVPDAFERLRRGEITRSTAMALLKLPTERQDELTQEETLTGAVAQSAVRAYNQSLLSDLDQIATPAMHGYVDLAAQLDAVVGRFSGAQRKLLAEAAELLRQIPVNEGVAA